MIASRLPSRDEMIQAFLDRDASFEGVFITAVKTTGIFCRPTCSARKPLPKNVEFFATTVDALFSGYRPCKRCKPMEAPGDTPDWIDGLLDAVEREPVRRWREADLRSLGLSPERVRRWFKHNHGMTFQAYLRARRLQGALTRIREGEPVTTAAFDSGYDSLSGFGSAIRRLTGTTPSEAPNMIHSVQLATPVGPMLAAANDSALLMLEFADRRMLETQVDRVQKRFGSALAPGSNEILRELESQLDAYFDGKLTRFTVPLGLSGTPFQETVWEALLEVPYGTTTHYGAIAERIGQPSAVRAVARANGDNRLAIIIPCHRIIGKDGKLTGYGGGLWRKRKLLDHEQGLFVLGSGPSGSLNPE